MAKNQINFTKMSKEATAQLNTFKDSALAIATEDLRYKAEIKPLKAQLENILANRQNDLDNGLSVEEVSAKFPRIEVDNKIRKAEAAHKAIVEPLTKSMKDTYIFIPEGMHDAYTKKSTSINVVTFWKQLKHFLKISALKDVLRHRSANWRKICRTCSVQDTHSLKRL